MILVAHSVRRLSTSDSDTNSYVSLCILFCVLLGISKLLLFKAMESSIDIKFVHAMTSLSADLL